MRLKREKEEKGREKEKVKRGKKRESSENQLYIRGLNKQTLTKLFQWILEALPLCPYHLALDSSLSV